ncbi:MAG: type IX secretion system membrane protein PorP/SprF [Cytophagaceae bacterium]|nr:type IX secretion system membrane protein PorP/SprF [Cytophagaceae bacterium]
MVFFISYRPVSAQSVKKYPVHFPLFFTAYPLINPASSGTQGFMDFRLGNLGNTGPLKEVKTLYANGSFLINKNSAQYKHSIGLTFYNDREGEPIQRTRFYGNYALHIPVGPVTYLNAGVSLGFANYSFRGSTSYSSGSDINYDGNAGLWLYSDKFHAGVSLNQFFNGKLRPIQEQFTLAPYLSFTGSRKLLINENFLLNSHLMLNFFDKKYIEADIALLAVIGKFISAGSSYRSERGLVWIAGLSGFPVLKNNMDLYFSYSMPFGARRNNVNTYQITLNYIFEKGKEAVEE